MVVSSSTPAGLQSEPIMLQLSIILLISHRNQKKRAKTWGETPRQMGCTNCRFAKGICFVDTAIMSHRASLSAKIVVRAVP